MSSPKTLILGLLSGMSYEQTIPFFQSLEKVGYTGDTCVFVRALEPRLLSYLQEHRVNLVPFQNAYLKPVWAHLSDIARPFLTPEQRIRLEEESALSYLHIACARFVYYRNYLRECGDAYDYVMLTDIRDVLFQADPFAFELPKGLGVFLEGDSKTLGTCATNAGWMREAFGDKVLKELSAQPISCAGTVLGTKKAVCDYLDSMVHWLCISKKRRAIDQAVHNYIINKIILSDIVRFDNASGPVLTLQYVDTSEMRFDKTGLVINAQERVINTIHQYDRYPELAKRLLERLT